MFRGQDPQGNKLTGDRQSAQTFQGIIGALYVGRHEVYVGENSDELAEPLSVVRTAITERFFSIGYGGEIRQFKGDEPGAATGQGQQLIDRECGSWLSSSGTIHFWTIRVHGRRLRWC